MGSVCPPCVSLAVLVTPAWAGAAGWDIGDPRGSSSHALLGGASSQGQCWGIAASPQKELEQAIVMVPSLAQGNKAAWHSFQAWPRVSATAPRVCCKGGCPAASFLPRHKRGSVWSRESVYALSCDRQCCTLVCEQIQGVREATQSRSWGADPARWQTAFFDSCSAHNQFVHCVFLERTYQQRLTTCSCPNFVLARAADGRNRGALCHSRLRRCSCCIAAPARTQWCLSAG